MSGSSETAKPTDRDISCEGNHEHTEERASAFTMNQALGSVLTGGKFGANLAQALPDPNAHTAGALPEGAQSARDEERIIAEVTQRLAEEQRIRVHYYVKIAVCAFLCALLLAFGIPVFMASRMTGSLSYTALGVVLIAFGLILAVSVVVLLFKPPKGISAK